MSENLKLFGLVTIKQDDEIVYEDIPNHWVNNGLKGLFSYLCGSYIYGYGAYVYTWCGTNSSNGFTLKVGTNTTTTTTFSMAELISLVVTLPNATMGNNVTMVSPGVWHLVLSSTWNAGVITQTIGEVGLYLNPFDTTAIQWSEQGLTKSQKLCSRISVADGTFAAFTPDPAKTLNIEWKVGVSF